MLRDRPRQKIDVRSAPSGREAWRRNESVIVRLSILFSAGVCLGLGLPAAAWALGVGDPVQLGVEGERRTFVVVQVLGTGGFKTAYRIRDTSPDCEPHCSWVMGVYAERIRRGRKIPEAIPAVAQLFEAGENAHVRFEIPRVTAEFDGRPQVVAMSEYADGQLLRTEWGNSVEPLRILGQQLYRGIQAFDDVDLVHLDIKPANILVMGRARPDANCLRTGDCYFVVADHDVIRPRGMPIVGSSPGTELFLPPEIRSLNGVRHFSPGIPLWATSLTLWHLFAAHYLSEETRLEANRFAARLRESLRPDAPPLAEEELNQFRAMMDRVLRERASRHRRRFDFREAREVDRLRTMIMNGFEVRPSQRRLELPRLELDAADQAREAHVAESLRRRRTAWAGIAGCRRPNVADVVRGLSTVRGAGGG